MKALTVHQPFAQLIATGRKPIETRSWATTYRGPLLIHASKHVDVDACNRLREGYSATGQVVALVDLVDCRPLRIDDEAAACCPYRPGAYAWVLANPTRIEPGVPAKGLQRLWAPSADVLAACLGGRAAQPRVMARRMEALLA